MSLLFIVLPLALLLAAVAVAGFTWAIRDGQYDDTESPAWRMVHEDDD